MLLNKKQRACDDNLPAFMNEQATFHYIHCLVTLSSSNEGSPKKKVRCCKVLTSQLDTHEAV